MSFSMYVPFQDATLLPVHGDTGLYMVGNLSLPRTDVIAARDASGSVWLAITNLDPNRAVTLRATISGARALSAVGEMLTAKRVDAVNTYEYPSLVAPRPFRGEARNGALELDIPAKSLVVVQVIE